MTNLRLIIWLLQAYAKLVQSFEAWQRQQQPNRAGKVLQATLLMVLPPKCCLSGGSQPVHMDVDQGIGYSRLCCQLVACGSSLENVWLMDDNILQCFQLNFGPGMLDGKLYHGRGMLQEVTIGHAMRLLEAAVLDRKEWKVSLSI